MKLLGLTQKGLLIIHPDKFELTDLDSESSQATIRVSKHPRSIIGDFWAVEAELKELMNSLFPSRVKPKQIVLCLNGQDEGGYTAIEFRAARELVYGATRNVVEIFVANRVLSATEAKEVLNGNSIEYINKDA